MLGLFPYANQMQMSPVCKLVALITAAFSSEDILAPWWEVSPSRSMASPWWTVSSGVAQATVN